MKWNKENTILQSNLIKLLVQISGQIFLSISKRFNFNRWTVFRYFACQLHQRFQLNNDIIAIWVFPLKVRVLNFAIVRALLDESAADSEWECRQWVRVQTVSESAHSEWECRRWVSMMSEWPSPASDNEISIGFYQLGAHTRTNYISTALESSTSLVQYTCLHLYWTITVYISSSVYLSTSLLL